MSITQGWLGPPVAAARRRFIGAGSANVEGPVVGCRSLDEVTGKRIWQASFGPSLA